MSINSRVSNGGYRAPPGSWDNPPSKYDRIWECYTSYLAINEQTNFTFPVTVAYNATSDPNGAVILDLAKRCGLDGSSGSDVDLTVYVKVCPSCVLIPCSLN